MSRTINLQALAIDSAMKLRAAPVLILPTIIATIASLFFYRLLFSRLDPQVMESLETLMASEFARQMVMTGYVTYVVLNTLAFGATTAMSRELLDSGRTSLSTALGFITSRFVQLAALSLFTGLSVVVGMMLFIFPGLLAAFYLMYAMAAFVMGESDALVSIQRSVKVVRMRLRESLMLFVTFVITYLALNLLFMIIIIIPFIGVLVAFAFSGAYFATLALTTLRAYRELISDIHADSASA